MSRSRIQLEQWLKTIDVTGRVLDVGGSQYPIKGRTKSWDVEEYKILDLENPHETKRKPDIVFDLNKNTLRGNGDKNKRERFDNVFCIEVMEYIWNPINAIEFIYDKLKNGGILYISFHFVYEIHPPRGEDMLRYTPSGACRILNESGFIILDMQIRTFDHPENSKRLYDNEGMRGDKGLSGIQGCMIKAKKI